MIPMVADDALDEWMDVDFDFAREPTPKAEPMALVAEAAVARGARRRVWRLLDNVEGAGPREERQGVLLKLHDGVLQSTRKTPASRYAAHSVLRPTHGACRHSRWKSACSGGSASNGCTAMIPSGGTTSRAQHASYSPCRCALSRLVTNGPTAGAGAVISVVGAADGVAAKGEGEASASPSPLPSPQPGRRAARRNSRMCDVCLQRRKVRRMRVYHLDRYCLVRTPPRYTPRRDSGIDASIQRRHFRGSPRPQGRRRYGRSLAQRVTYGRKVVAAITAK